MGRARQKLMIQELTPFYIFAYHDRTAVAVLANLLADQFSATQQCLLCRLGLKTAWIGVAVPFALLKHFRGIYTVKVVVVAMPGSTLSSTQYNPVIWATAGCTLPSNTRSNGCCFKSLGATPSDSVGCSVLRIL